MPKKSSKTAHVLNLLTTEEDLADVVAEGDEEGTAGRKVAEPAPADISQGRTRITIEDDSADPLSNLLKNELEKQFVQRGEAPLQTMTAGDTILLSGNKSEEAKKMTEDTEMLGSDPSNYIAINIVEDVVKTKASAFVERMGGCMCYRCINDVIALALNELPPQYTVTHKGMLMAKVASYENQHTADITAALTKACIMVKNSPRH